MDIIWKRAAISLYFIVQYKNIYLEKLFFANKITL